MKRKVTCFTSMALAVLMAVSPVAGSSVSVFAAEPSDDTTAIQVTPTDEDSSDEIVVESDSDAIEVKKEMQASVKVGDTGESDITVETEYQAGDSIPVRVTAENPTDTDADFRLYFWDYAETLPEDKAEWSEVLTDACEDVKIAELQDTDEYAVELKQGGDTVQSKASFVSDKDDKDQLTAAYLSIEFPAEASLDTVFHISSDTAETVTIVPVFDAESENPFYGDAAAAQWIENPIVVEADETEETTETELETEDADAIVVETEEPADSFLSIYVGDGETETAETETEAPVVEAESETDANAEAEAEADTESEPAIDTESEVSVEAESEEDDAVTVTSDTVDLNASDFASMRLVVLADDASVIANDSDVIGQYGNVYLLQFTSIQQTMNAYTYYKDKVQAVEPDATVETAAETESVQKADITMTEDENPVAMLNEVEASEEVQDTHGVIALIDTGVSESENVIDRVSVIDDALEGNGHGDAMVKAIVSQDAEAQILSIRAMDDNGLGTVSSLVAAMEYAIEQKVDIINLSLYAKATLSTSAIKEEILKALDAGILVVGSAGNDGQDAAGYMPGAVEEAYIIGAATDEGFRQETSNFGATVDYYVLADTTSEAAALFTGFLSANGVEAVDTEAASGLIVPMESISSGNDSTDGGIETFTINLSQNPDDSVSTASFDNPNVVTVNNERYDYFSWSTTNPGTASCPGLGTGMKYIVGDDKNVDGRGMWRYVYCLEVLKSSPTGMQATYTDSFTNRQVAYALYYGAVYYYNTCRYAPYSTGDWRMDYWVTQMAVHILNNEFTLDTLWYSMNQPGSSATQAHKELAYDRVSKIVRDARNPGNYGGFTGDGWLDMATGKFSLSGYKNSWSKSNGTWYSGGNFHANFTSYYGYDYREQITEYNVDVTDGASVSKSDTKTYSDFRVAISDSQYKEWQKTGKTIDVNVTMEIPRYWGGGVYASADPNIQPVAFLTWSAAGGTATYKDSAQLTIEQVPQDGYLTLKKSSGNTSITDGNSNYSLAGAVYTVYKNNNNGKLSGSQGTLTTNADGTTGKLKLTQGTYYVQETTAPSGYQKDTKIYTVKITTSHTSSAPYKLEVSDTPQTGNLKITKKSALPEISNNNDCYSLEGAEFTIYKNAACTQVYKTIKTNKDGVATCSDMPLGKYWVKETKAPKGFELNTEFYEPITITASHTASKPLSLTCTDVPGNDPTGIEITKIQNGEHTDTIPTLEGTQFTIKYYDGFYKNESELKGKTPERTWVLEVKYRETTGKYQCVLADAYLVDGSDEFYRDGSGLVCLPYGTITIQETKPAAGYTLNGYLVDENGKKISTDSELYVAQITDESGGVQLQGGNKFTGYNTPVSGSIKLKKYDSDGTTPLAGVTFELTNSKGEVVGEKTTGSNGEVLFDDLYPDIYTVTETKTVSGHTLLAEPIVVKVPMRVTEEYINDNNIKDDAVIYDPAEDIYYIHNFTYEITNDVTFKMPMSGGLITPMTFVPLIAGMGIMSGLGVVGFRKKRKK